MSRLGWYWHRLRAMSAGEMALHARKKLRQMADAKGPPDFSRLRLESSGAFPKLPRPEDAPQVLREALKQDGERILSGHWCAFTHLDLRVDDPPRWHKDYLAGVDLETNESAFKLNHRELPNGADIKLIWELSRWHELVRLAMAAYVLNDARAAEKCLAWLEDWVKHNPPYRGWNWTSALEAGMRLVQFTWIDALLSNRVEMQPRLATLRRAVLPPHIWFTWRHISFGSSANNHLIGELAGLIVATVRWPDLQKCGPALEDLQQRFVRETLLQFAEDGGNREQALNYQLFSWEFCWQARAALLSAERHFDRTIDSRLKEAAKFFVWMQVERELWDYGDSDNAFVTPFAVEVSHFGREWHEWFAEPATSPAIDYWWQQTGPSLAFNFSKPTTDGDGWAYFKQSGYGIWRRSGWTIRWDLSQLGYLKTAAHGHLDALHLSLWYRGVAMVIDPGTGAYYADPELRKWLASASVHNGPRSPGQEPATRLGPFLWSENIEAPRVDFNPEGSFSFFAGFPGKHGCRRMVAVVSNKISVLDNEIDLPGNVRTDEFVTTWQFAPGANLTLIGERHFRLKRDAAVIEIEVSEGWAEVLPVTERSQSLLTSAADELERKFAGTVSPAFRRTEWAPYLKLVARPKPGEPCVFRTTFVASPPS